MRPPQLPKRPRHHLRREPGRRIPRELLARHLLEARLAALPRLAQRAEHDFAPGDAAGVHEGHGGVPAEDLEPVFAERPLVEVGGDPVHLCGCASAAFVGGAGAPVLVDSF